ncbi:MAG: hypothetical protein Q3M24_18255 [Candidatus Electrothrix aestuarii]|uniref:Uncharacterized protein n=1 Tax=Candidatus Electrothrix aestuarii TaxID=3062594 RepID=A0AAU8LSQ9_9BACT
MKAMYTVQLILLFSLSLACPVHAATDISTLEKDYFSAYDTFYDQAVQFHGAVKAVRPPADFTLTEQDLTAYHAQLEKLYAKKPEYRDMAVGEAKDSRMVKQIAELVGASPSDIGRYEASYDISHMTGLSHREMAVVQKAGGLSSLRQLIWSVERLPNRQWVAWYFTLIGHSDSTAEKLLFQDDRAGSSQLAEQREKYSVAAKAFKQAREHLETAINETLAASQDVVEKNRLAVKQFIFANISKKAGSVGWGRENRGGYPLQAPDKKHYAQAAALAERLQVPFEDLAFIKKAEGNYGLRKLVRGMAWVEDREAMLAEVFK